MMRYLGLIGCLVLFLASSLAVSLRANDSPVDLADFRYRIPIRLEEKSGAVLKDFQIRISIQGVDINQPWCMDFSHMQPGGRDIRFVNEAQPRMLSGSEETLLGRPRRQLLDFWIESWDDTDKTASIWVKIPQIEASTSTCIYLYYGNPEAKALSFPSEVAQEVSSREIGTTTTRDSSFGTFDRTMQKLRADEDTAGLWHFDGSGEVVRDSSLHQNHSTYFKAMWLGQDGGGMTSRPEYRFSDGNALVFNGQDEYVEIPYHESFDFTGSERISLEAWIRPATPTQYTAILAKRGMYGLYLSAEGKVSCFLWGPRPRAYHTAQSSLPLNEWSHIGVTYNGQRISFYLNGQLDNEVKVSGLIRPPLDRIHPEGPQRQKVPLYIGNDPNAEYHRFFQGAIDEVRILRRVLSAEEIKADYERRAYAPVEPELSLGEEEKLDD